MYRLGDVCFGVTMTVLSRLAFIFDPLLLFWFLFLKYFILYKYVTLYCVFFISSTLRMDVSYFYAQITSCKVF